MGVKSRCRHWLTRLFPSEWRDRYGDEFDALIEQESPRWRQIADVTKAAAVEQISSFSRLGAETMQTYPGNLGAVARKPSAIVPLAMSAAALITVVVAVSVAGATHEPDEGVAAHIFQLLIAGQLPFVAWFVLRWFKRDFRAALVILGLQILGIALALFPVWYFGL